MRIARVDADFGSRDGLSAGLTFGVGDAILLALARSDSQLAREAACWHSSEDRVPAARTCSCSARTQLLPGAVREAWLEDRGLQCPSCGARQEEAAVPCQRLAALAASAPCV